MSDELNDLSAKKKRKRSNGVNTPKKRTKKSLDEDIKAMKFRRDMRKSAEAVIPNSFHHADSKQKNSKDTDSDSDDGIQSDNCKTFAGAQSKKKRTPSIKTEQISKIDADNKIKRLIDTRSTGGGIKYVTPKSESTLDRRSLNDWISSFLPSQYTTSIDVDTTIVRQVKNAVDKKRELGSNYCALQSLTHFHR